jgi:hypothetical protein
MLMYLKSTALSRDLAAKPQSLPPQYRVRHKASPLFSVLRSSGEAAKGRKQTLAHTVKISTGRALIFMVGEEETSSPTQTRTA